MKVRFFLSHPMSGIPEEEVLELRRKMTEYLVKRYPEFQVEIINNYHHEDAPINAGRLWHLGKSIQLMEKADIVVFSPDWQKAKGCKIEKKICRSYGIPYQVLTSID